MKQARPTTDNAKPLPAGEPTLAVWREKTEADIAQLVTPLVTALGYALVRVQLAGSRGGLTLQLMAERQDGTAMQVDDCRSITQAVDAPLDEADLIPGAYALEVSSPGIDRPLTRAQDYVNWAGFEAKVALQAPQNGRKNFRGRLQGLQDGQVLMQIDGAVAALPLTQIAKAQLVLTDELIKATAAREAAALAAKTKTP